jgi:hypothetical protein
MDFYPDLSVRGEYSMRLLKTSILHRQNTLDFQALWIDFSLLCVAWSYFVSTNKLAALALALATLRSLNSPKLPEQVWQVYWTRHAQGRIFRGRMPNRASLWFCTAWEPSLRSSLSIEMIASVLVRIVAWSRGRLIDGFAL